MILNLDLFFFSYTGQPICDLPKSQVNLFGFVTLVHFAIHSCWGGFEIFYLFKYMIKIKSNQFLKL